MKKIAVVLTAIVVLLSFAVCEAGVKEAKDFMKKRMFPSAISALKKEIAKDGGSAEARFLLGACYVQTGNIYSAHAEFEEAVVKDPGYGSKVAGEYKNLALSNLYKGQLGEAEEMVEKALYYQPDLVGVIGEGYAKAGMQYIATNQTDKAEALFKKAMRYSPNLIFVIGDECLKKGAEYLQWQQPETAEKLFSLAVSFSGSYGGKVCDTYFNAGKEGRNEKDFELLEKAKQYCKKYDEEILEIMIAKLPGKTIRVEMAANEMKDIAPVKEGQKWRYLYFQGSIAHFVCIGNCSFVGENWREISNTLPWRADRTGLLQVKATTPAVFIIKIAE